MSIKPASPDDVIRWPDGTVCLRRDLWQYEWKSDDYEVITEEHPEYDLLTTEEG